MSNCANSNAPYTLADLIRMVRLRLDDLPGDVVDSDLDWQTDDSSLLWKNSELVQYINEAYVDACYRKPILDSTTPAITELAYDPLATNSLAYSPLVVTIDQALWQLPDGDHIDLVKTSAERLANSHSRWRDATSTAPQYYYIDADHNELVLWPSPTVASNVKLVVDRIRLTPLTWPKRMTEKVELKDDYQIYLVDYACFRAWMKHDTETLNLKASEQAFSLYERAMGLRLSAQAQRNQLLERRMYRRTKANFF